jgi:leader peptidase (prepilin peptidase)/N-methyltransferase
MGIALGWLINYLSDVLPETRTLSAPVCWKCKHQYTFWDYLLVRKCSSCDTRRRVRSFIVPIFLLVIFTWLWIFPRQGVPYPISILLLTYLSLVFIIDLEHRLILHPVSITGAVLGLVVGVVLRGRSSISHGLWTTLAGGAAGFSIMLVLYYLGEWYVRRLAKSKKVNLPPDEVALGFGDVNLAGITGLVLGWPAVLAGLFFAVLAGGLISLLIIVGMLISKKYKAFTAIPYAPFLILGLLILLYLM